MRLAILLLLMVTTAFAAEKKYDVRDFAPTRYISGPRLTPAMLKDKATLMVFWAYVVNGTSSGQSLKTFQKISESHPDDLVVIGIENLNAPGSAKLIPLMLKGDGITFPNYSGCRAPIKIGEAPFLCAFDRDGKMTYSGHLKFEELDEILSEALTKPDAKGDKAEPKKDIKTKPGSKKAA